MGIRYSIALILFLGIPVITYAQGILENGQVHGNFQIDAQYYQPDDALGITDSTLNGKVYGMNAFGKIKYTNGNFSAGLRYEAYLPPLKGFDLRYEGQGIPYWFAEYKWDKLDITVGHFYEQFGNGLLLRSYEEWTLGFDNSINGARVRYEPFKGVRLKTLAGTQRYFWNTFADAERGIIRGVDLETNLNDIIKPWNDSKTRIILGGSFVSKYEDVKPKSLIQDTTIYQYKLPRNVAAYAGRMNLSHGGFNLTTEYARKLNDPNALNNYIYRKGEALFTSVSYATKGFGITLSGKRLDNMNFKSLSTEGGSVLDINYLPPLTKQHVYSLVSIYPYATQPNGEMGFQGQVIYTIPRRSAVGGKYGTKIELDYSIINSLDKERVKPDIPIDSTGTLGYESDFFSVGDELFFQDISAKISRKLSSKWKMILGYSNLSYNIEVIEGHSGAPTVYANVGILDLTYKIRPTHSIRLEYQHLLSEQDRGDWSMALLEYNIAPKWFFSVMDEYNYGNPDNDMQLHYYSVAVAYVKGATRMSLSYGRQREGLLCVGGVCRVVPASSGFSMTVTSSF